MKREELPEEYKRTFDFLVMVLGETEEFAEFEMDIILDLAQKRDAGIPYQTPSIDELRRLFQERQEKAKNDAAM